MSDRATTAPATGQVQGRETCANGADAIQQVVAATWAELLGLAHVDADDRLSMIGGTSITAIHAALAIGDRLGTTLRLPIAAPDARVADYARQIRKALDAHVRPSAAPPPSGDNAGDSLASCSQELVWFLDQLDDAWLAYRFHARLSMRGALSLPCLREAMDQLVERHEILRTSFTLVDGRLHRHELPARPAALSFLDLGMLDEEHRQEALREGIDQVLASRFDLARPPLFRWDLFRLADDEHLLLITEHHIIHDGHSFRVLLQDLQACYNALVRGRALQLPAIEARFGDFCREERDWLRSQHCEQQVQAWRTHVEPFLTLPPPFAHRQPAGPRSHRGAQERRALGAARCQRLLQAAASLNSTPFTLALAVFGLVCVRHGAQDRLIIGTSVANRPSLRYQSTLGMFVNPVMIPFDADGDEGFDALVRRTGERVQFALAHGGVPMTELIQRLQTPHRTRGASPFRVAFSFHDALPLRSDFEGLAVDVEEGLPNGSAKFDINVIVVVRGEDRDTPMHLVVEYRSDMFSAGDAARIVDDYLALLDTATGSCRQRVHALLDTAWPTGPADEVDSRSPRASGDFVSPQDMFDWHVRQHPQRRAVVSSEGALSYAELDARVERIAGALQQRGIGPGHLVPVCLARGPDLVAAMLAVLRVGAAFVPLDPALPPARVAHILAETDATLVLTQSALIAAWATHRAQALPVDAILDQPAIRLLQRPVSTPDSPVYCIYTSGSSGTPKGVLVGAGAVVNLMDDWLARFPSRPRECFSWWTSCSFDVSIFEWLLPLCSGACVALPDEDARLDPRAFLQWATRQGVSTAYLPPHIARLLPTLVAQGIVPPSRLLLGVEPLDEKRLHDALAPLDVTVVNGYGPTEATVYATLHTQPLAPLQRPIPIGRPIANTAIHLLDEQLRPVPPGVPGTLHIAGAGLALGYLKQPELTARKFIPCPFGPPGALMYDTGDRARWLDDGSLAFIGRLDAQVKVRGFRIELGEIEQALLRTGHVREAAVLAEPDATGSSTLHACVVPSDAADCRAETMRKSLADWLPDYMLPATFVVLDRLPLTPSGKLDRRALSVERDGQAQRARLERQDRAKDLGTDDEVPRTDDERAMAALWQDLLGVGTVGRNDDFFSLGGHSLLAARLVATLSSRPDLGMSLTLRQVLATPILSQLALAAGGGSAAEWQAVPVRSGGAQPPLFCIHGSDGDVAYAVNLAAGLPADMPVYGLCVRSPDEGSAPELSITQWADRHVRLIRDVQPQGPYRLCGWSAGGTIAHEAARLLAREGEQVEALFLIDTRAQYEWPSGSEPPVPPHLDARQSRTHRRIVKGLAAHAPTALDLVPHLFVATRETRHCAALGWETLYGAALRVRRYDAGHYDIVSRAHAVRLGQEIGEILSTRRRAVPATAIQGHS
ncbi:hypothetical protein CDN99_17860 [Roseateles aquatilis]|uniref:Carrier domain-containing protein n=1 Tax=Roseateles aquatilis TaxID=431061 RepID=A0A246J4E2_9BURK|nr:non-ribosomal peptide synthetase [Roseateles aquatilis]OWQ87470.1 hypothetical protein CDN99_17860 [Roseateles aquatilis]